MLRVGVGHGWAIPVAMLKTRYVRGDVRISGEMPLVDARPIDKQPGVVHVWIVGFLVLVCVVAGGW